MKHLVYQNDTNGLADRNLIVVCIAIHELTKTLHSIRRMHPKLLLQNGSKQCILVMFKK